LKKTDNKTIINLQGVDPGEKVLVKENGTAYSKGTFASADVLVVHQDEDVHKKKNSRNSLQPNSQCLDILRIKHSNLERPVNQSK